MTDATLRDKRTAALNLARSLERRLSWVMRHPIEGREILVTRRYLAELDSILTGVRADIVELVGERP